jgi:hypothetical protein
MFRRLDRSRRGVAPFARKRTHQWIDEYLCAFCLVHPYWKVIPHVALCVIEISRLERGWGFIPWITMLDLLA